MTTQFRQLCNPHQHPMSLDTASPLDTFIKRDKELGSGCTTMTDHGTLAGAMDFYASAIKNKIQPIIGVEAYLFDPDCSFLKLGGIDDPKAYNKYYHLTMHCMDEPAYKALVQKLSTADRYNSVWAGSEKKPLFTWKDLEELGQYNFTYCSSCLAGVVSNHLKNDRPDLAVQYYEKIRSLVKPGHFYVEVFPHNTTEYWTDGVFVEYLDGTKEQFRPSKKVRVNGIEMTAADMPHMIGKALQATRYRTTWTDIEPKIISKASAVKGFVKNECTPFAPDGDLQLSCNKFMLDLAQKHGDKVIVSLDSHYATKDYKDVQTIKLTQQGWGPFFGSYHIYSSDEAFAYFKSRMGVTEKQYSEWIDNSYEWASLFKDFKLTKENLLPRSRYPSDTEAHLRKLVKDHGRFDDSREMRDRLETEIHLFKNNGTIDLLPYFFTAEDFCNAHEKEGILLGSSRGSVGGVLTAYLLGITHVNPLKHDLSLDRFITLDRIASGKMPDIDTDFSTRDYLLGKGGYLDTHFKDRYAQISTIGTLKLKSSIKNVFRHTSSDGRVPYDVDKLASSLPDEPQGIKSVDFLFGYEDSDDNHIDGLFETDDRLRKLAQRFPKQWALIVKCLAVPINRGRHASAFGLSDRDLILDLPLTTLNGDENSPTVTQYTMAGVEAAGVMKFDFLGLSTLKDIQGAINLVQKDLKFGDSKHQILNGKKVPNFRIIPFKGKLYDVWDLPNEPDVFTDIAEGKTETVFQLNTSAARKWLKEFNYTKPGSDERLISNIDEIAYFTSLDRPGPLDAFTESNEGKRINMLQEYARRARGIENPLEIKALRQLVPETYAIMVTQEQIQNTFQVLTGCSGIDANNFRDKIGKKKMEEVLATKPFFIKEASKKISPEDAEAIWGQIVTAGQYAFNFSHAVGYSYVAYACAFLKHYYPLEWWCSVLQNADKEKIFEQHWVHVKHLVDMPDIVRSGAVFEIKNGRIVAPLEFLKGVGEKAHDELIQCRPYVDIQDFCNSIEAHKQLGNKMTTTGKIIKGRSALNSGVVSKLILTGAMDPLFPVGTDLYSKLDGYAAAQAASQGKRKWKRLPILEDLNPLKIYQTQKQIIPIYSQSLLSKLPGLGLKEIRSQDFTHSDGRTITSYSYFLDRKEGYLDFLFVDAPTYRKIAQDISYPVPTRLAVIGYVMSERTFNWGEKDPTTGSYVGQKNEAMALTVEVDGDIIDIVKWGNRNTGKLQNVVMNRPDGTTLSGSIVILLLQKFKPEGSFAIGGIQMVENSLSQPEDTDE